MINDTSLCSLAKKLNGVSPNVVIDDPLRVEELLNQWWSKLMADSISLVELTDAEDDALTVWVRSTK